jgi:hypothetical protein
LFAPHAIPSSVIVQLLSTVDFETTATTASALSSFFARVSRHRAEGERVIGYWRRDTSIGQSAADFIGELLVIQL